MATPEANAWLTRTRPEYLFHSSLRDVDLHGIPMSGIEHHYQPRVRAAALGEGAGKDPLDAKARRVLIAFEKAAIPIASCGITGSLLVGAQTARSDIDLVVYDRADFYKARVAIQAAIRDRAFEPLNDALWRDAFSRRASSLTLEEYVWHERRKYNKLVIDGTKVDVSLVTTQEESPARWRKEARHTLRAEVTDDRGAFDFPARYAIGNREIPEVVSYTNTYTGQAFRGETIEASGWREVSDDGTLRLMVGTSREAGGEFIRVVRS